MIVAIVVIGDHMVEIDTILEEGVVRVDENSMIVDTDAQASAAITIGRTIVVLTIVVHMTVGQVTVIEIEVE